MQRVKSSPAMLSTGPVPKPLRDPRGLCFPTNVQHEPDNHEDEEGENAEEEEGHLHQPVHHHVPALVLHLIHQRVGQLMCQGGIDNLHREEPHDN